MQQNNGNANNGLRIAIEEAKKMVLEMEIDLYNISRLETGAKLNKKIEIKAIKKLIEHLEKLPQDDGWIKFEDESPQPKK